MLPVLVRPCLWQEVPSLREVQWAHDPDRDGPIALARGARRDSRIVEVCTRLVGLVKRSAPPTSEEPEPGVPGTDGDVAPVALSRRVGKPGWADGVPPLPRYHAPRPELGELRAALLDPGSGVVGVTGGVPGVGLAGRAASARRCWPPNSHSIRRPRRLSRTASTG